ncbi:MAG TPA: hypothetical protein VGL89_17580 [Candidatus Koribacter sp.]|jgi:hypothetical protein
MKRWVFLIPAVLFVSILASASGKSTPFPATVVSAQSHTAQAVDVTTSSCNFEDYDGYCNMGPKEVTVAQVILRENDGKTIHAECRDGESCALPVVNQTVSARYVGTGVELKYRDAAARDHKEVFRVVREGTATRD